MEAIRHRLLTAFFRDLRPVCPNCQAVIPPWAKLHVLPYPTNENEAAPPTERSGAGHADLLDACALKIRCGDERPCRCRLQLHIRAPGGDPIFALAKSATMKHHNVCDLDLSPGASTTFKAIPRRGRAFGRSGRSVRRSCGCDLARRHQSLSDWSRDRHRCWSASCPGAVGRVRQVRHCSNNITGSLGIVMLTTLMPATELRVR